ncbi:hypothetical protein BKA70DRAFT_1435490 [Coprinopsis sp. MPI-PUGE-AT-0042]|nr:hypothetical protein BKA70DRAFT_1435490 [Coprinopsis sp. MPI-PUGE-AT-0042]
MSVQAVLSMGASQISLAFGAVLVYASLISLQVFLCVHSFIKYLKSPPHVRKTRKHYVRVMLATSFFSMATFAFDVALFYISTGNWKPQSESAELAIWLGLNLCIGLTHLVADGLLVSLTLLRDLVGKSLDWVGSFDSVSCIPMGVITLLSGALCLSPSSTNILCRNHGLILHRGIYYLLATSVNTTATALICVRLLRAKVRIETIMTPTSSTTTTVQRLGGTGVPYTMLTMVFMESALPFTVLGIITAALTITDVNSTEGVSLFSYRLWIVASGPTAEVIAYRVIAGISSASTWERESDVLSHSIRFAVNDPLSGSRDSTNAM